MEYLRTNYYLGGIEQENSLYENLAQRSGHSFEWIRSFFKFMEDLRQNSQISEEDLMKLNTLIEKFKATPYGRNRRA